MGLIIVMLMFTTLCLFPFWVVYAYFKELEARKKKYLTEKRAAIKSGNVRALVRVFIYYREYVDDEFVNEIVNSDSYSDIMYMQEEYFKEPNINLIKKLMNTDYYQITNCNLIYTLTECKIREWEILIDLVLKLGTKRDVRNLIEELEVLRSEEG